MIEGQTRPLGDARASRASCPAAARSCAPRARTRSTSTAASSAVLEHLRGLDALVAIGGEDTLGVAARLHAEHGAHVVGVPKTIDNDLRGTDYTFGFDTAVTIATEAIDRLHSTAESHDRVMVCEVMGRHTGWIAVMAGMAGGADVILIPELPMTVERCCELIQQPARAGQGLLDRRRQRGLRAALRDRRVARRRVGRRRRVRPRPAGRRRRRARGRDRGSHRVRDARDDARPHPARRLADRPRPRARDPLRAARRPSSCARAPGA